MAVFSNFNFLLVGFILGVFFTIGNAGSIEPQVQSIAEETIRKSLPAHLYDTLFGQTTQLNRFKRAIVHKNLTDPNNCVQQCHENQTNAIITATIQNMGRLVALALQEVKWEDVNKPEKKAEMENTIKEKTIANMGPLFDDMCGAGKQADVCYSQCPKSQLRNIVSIENQAGIGALCEHGRNWNNFTDYWNALNCTNTTEAEKPCDNKCGHEKKIDNVTHLDLETQSSSAILQYEDDAKVNTAAVGPACKSTLCKIDCYKPIMTKKCGQKAYDMYTRMTVLEPHSSLRILKELNAVGDNPDCKSFQ